MVIFRLGLKKIILKTVIQLSAIMKDMNVENGLIVTTNQQFSSEAKSFARFYKIKITPIAEFLTKPLDKIINSNE